MERRKFPRQDVRGIPLRATLVLTGGSLLNRESCSSVEIDARLIDLSEGGIRLSLGLKAHWATFSPQREVDLFLVSNKGRSMPFKATVVRFHEDVHELGLEFEDPDGNVSDFVQQASLH